MYVSQAWIGSNLVDMGRERCIPKPFGVGNSWVGFGDRPGDHGEVLRGSRGEAAGTESDSSSVERINSEHGNRPGPAVLPGIRSGGSAGRTDRRSAQGGAEPS